MRWHRRDKLHLAGITGVIVLLNVLGWGVLILVVAPQHLALGTSGVFGGGIGVTAFFLGVRHAFDADHIAVIDNTTRKFVGEGKAALDVGFWFALGHSTIVFVAASLLALGLQALAATVQDTESTLARTLALFGSIAAGGFLILIGLINWVSAMGILRVFRKMRGSGLGDESELERQLDNRGFLARILRGATRRITKPWHVYPVGLLMGLGFDTASQVALLVLAAGTAAFSLPWYAILVLPVLFTAGMTTFDTADGVLMSRAYGWAFLRPVRKVFYNLTVTVLSVIVALVVGVIVLLGLAAEKFGITSGPIAAIGSLDLDNVGFIIFGLFIITWLIALSIWKVGRIEQRWSAPGPD